MTECLPPVPHAPVVQDPTLDDLRVALARALPEEAIFDGWTPQALARAATATGIDPDVAQIAFPGGAVDMIDAWYATIDGDMLADLPAEQLAAMRIRDRITALVEARLKRIQPVAEAAWRAQSVLAQPRNLPHAARLGWRAADVMWRAAGDTATDYNHYTKRTLLAGVYASTLLAMRGDQTPDLAFTRAFLARRIDAVMRFEKWKARMSSGRDEHFSITRLLGRLRYPAR